MNDVSKYVEHIPAIEKAIADGNFDALVIGMGPTAWLLPWIDQKLLKGVRMWGCHDACRIMPMDDLLLMDNPINFLDPDTTRHAEIVKSRPKRLWVYKEAWKTKKHAPGRTIPGWEQYISKGMHSITQTVEFGVWQPRQVMRPPKFKIAATPPHTTCVSPTGCTSLAWREGARRIGIIGVDMMPLHHISHQFWRIVAHCFCCFAQDAHERGGCVTNLSPITALTPFKEWKPSTSTSAPTNGSATPELSASSSTALANMQPVPLSSTGCEPVIPVSRLLKDPLSATGT